MKCGPTRKTIFKCEKAAQIRADEIVGGESNRKFTPNHFRIYKCEFCGFFHLSGKGIDRLVET